MKIAIVICYKYPDYVRTRTIRKALAQIPDLELVTVANSHTGLLRYPEVLYKLLKLHKNERPDAYLMTFRGYEILLAMVLMRFKTPIIFDEFINFTEWMEEHRLITAGTILYRVFRAWYGWLADHARVILADTPAHAQYSAKLNDISTKRYRAIPVGTDETVFYPAVVKSPLDGNFTVFYYGHMLPLHGLKYVLKAAVLLKDQKQIDFRFVGGGKKVVAACAAAQKAGARLTHEAWLPFEHLAEAARASSLTLGGPFGDTLQSQYVITGKTYQFLALGKPVLIGKNQVNESFEDKRNSLIVPQADARAIARAIEWASLHPRELSQIGRAGRALYERQFSQAIVNHMVSDLIADFATVIPKSKQG